MNEVMAKLKQIIEGLKILGKQNQSIKADTTEIGRMLQAFYQEERIKNSKNDNRVDYNRPFTIKNMTDAQAKDLLIRQGLSPQLVSKISDNKFTVQYLINMVQK
jgi:hypothetical protein